MKKEPEKWGSCFKTLCRFFIKFRDLMSWVIIRWIRLCRKQSNTIKCHTWFDTSCVASFRFLLGQASISLPEHRRGCGLQQTSYDTSQCFYKCSLAGKYHSWNSVSKFEIKLWGILKQNSGLSYFLFVSCVKTKHILRRPTLLCELSKAQEIGNCCMLLSLVLFTAVIQNRCCDA